MGFFDSISDIVKTVKGAKDIIEPIVNIGLGAHKTSSIRGAREDLIQQMIDQETKSYEDQKTMNQYYFEQAQANSAARQAAAAANRAAANATEKNRQKALKKAMNRSDLGFENAKSLFRPYVDVGNRLLPRQEETYGNALNGINMLSAYLSAPDQIKKLAGGKSIYDQNVPIPKALR